MSLQQLRNEIEKLKNSAITRYEPQFKIFTLGKPDSPTEEEIQEFAAAHPHTKVMKFYLKSFRKA